MAKATSIAEDLRPKKRSGVTSVTLQTKNKSVTLHADGRTESSGLNGESGSVVEALVEGAGVAPAEGGKLADIGPMNMVTLVRVPTKLGPCCSDEDSKYATASVGIKREGDDKCLLWATNGFSAVIVPAEICDYGEAAKPVRLPAVLSVPGKDGARELRCGVGTKETIFGFQRVWVDELAGRFEPEAIEGADPPIHEVFPVITGGECAYLSINAEMLLKLAQAVNSPNGPNATINVVLAVNLSDKKKPMAVIGDEGVAILMQRNNGEEKLDSPKYVELVKRLKNA